MSKQMSRVVCVVVLGFFALPGQAADAANARRKLRNGFEVAAGSKQVGPVFPRIALNNPAFDGWAGWTAVLDVTGDAGAVYDEYVGQARRLGLDVGYSDQRCREAQVGDVVCYGSASASGMAFGILLRVCATCAIPVSGMTIELITKGGRPFRGVPLEQSPPPPRFATHLDAEMRLRRRLALPEAGHEIPFGDDGQFPRPRLPLRVAGGTTAVATQTQECLEGGAATVLRSDRSVGDVFAKYRDQVRRQGNEAPPRVTRRTRGETDIAVVNGDYATVDVVRAMNGTWVLANQCFG